MLLLILGIYVERYISRSPHHRTTIFSVLPPTMLPDIFTLKISELKAELHLYGIDITGLSEKQDLISALKTAREALPNNDREGDATTISCCAECGKEEDGDLSLKTCKSCKAVKYCGAACQRKHWPKHKNECKQRAAELRDEALFKDPPAKEDCPICFLPMTIKFICCASLPPATISSVPIADLAFANEELANKFTKQYYSCCGKSICQGCIYSFYKSGNIVKCPFCNSDRGSKTAQEQHKEVMKRVAANDPDSICVLANNYFHGLGSVQQNHEKVIELWKQAADLGHSDANFNLGRFYEEGGDLTKSFKDAKNVILGKFYERGDKTKAKFHYESAAMGGHELARYNLGIMEAQTGNMERAFKHLRIAASAGHYKAMHNLRKSFEGGFVSRESIEATLTAYNNSCVEMRSEARDNCIHVITEKN
jgi:TPR repeat protein